MNDLKELKKNIQIEMIKMGFDSQRSLAKFLGITEGMLSECINFKMDSHGRLKGSSIVWLKMEKLFRIDIINHLKALGLR